PRRASSAAAAMPLRAAPTTVTRLPLALNSIAPLPRSLPRSSPQLQGRQAEQRTDDGGDDEPGDHLWLAPAEELEVMMKRRHPEQSLTAGRLEITDLQDDREDLDREHSADDHQQDLL